MKSLAWILGIFLFLFLIIFSGALFFYQWGGLRYFLNATSYINSTEASQRASLFENFYAADRPSQYGGILAGTWFGKIWVWGKSGLQYFTVDANTVYSWFDGCNPDTQIKINRGVLEQVERTVDTGFEKWKAKGKVGDYVVVIIIKPEVDGATGNAGEVYDYNYWPFIQNDIYKQCAKQNY